MICVKDDMAYFTQNLCNKYRDHGNGFYSRRVRFGSISNMAWQDRIQPGSRMEVSEWKITKRKHWDKGNSG